jgi:enamine deaminase RidA (YjgF/YER057c/UK114 family)
LLPLSLVALQRLSAQEAPRFLNPSTLPPTHGYSQVAEVPPGRRLVILSGQVPLDSAGNLVGAGDFRAQATQTFRNIGAALAASGATYRDVVKVTYFIRNAADLTTLREVRDQFVNTVAPPASTLVVVQGLYRPDVLLEVEATAAVTAGP